MPPRRFLPTLFLVIACGAALAEEPAWKWQSGLVPDAGFDLDAAQVVRVTTLAPQGRGSLHAALKTKGPRLIVFDVAGVIPLDRKSIEVHEPDAYIAGQTAPSPGITVIRGGLSIEADRVVLQHLRVRPGDAGKAKGSGWEPDGITTSGGPADIWIDHCSATWSVDENISASTYKSATGLPARRIFIRHCIIAEGLSNGPHGKGEHSKGTLIFDGTQQVAIVGNLYASNTERNPVFKRNTSGVVVNCVIANPGQRAIHASAADVETAALPNARIAVVGNLVLCGEKTKKTAAIFDGIVDGYFKDNEGYNWQGGPLPLLRIEIPVLDTPPVWPEGLTPLTPAAAQWNVARFAGARPAERDAIDTRIVREALTGAGRIIDSQEGVGGYPKIEPVTRVLEVPASGRREWLEKITRVVMFGEEAEVPTAKSPAK